MTKVKTKLANALQEGWLFTRYFIKQDHFADLPESPRGLEWLLSCALIMTGAWAWITDHLDKFVESPFLWIFTLIIIGFVRIAALIINGSWRRSPILRTVGAVSGATCWSYLALQHLNVEPSTGIGMIYVLFVWAELYSTVRSTRDAVLAYVPEGGTLDGRTNPN